VFGYLAAWQSSGDTARMHDRLRMACRIAASRKPGPSAAVIDSQAAEEAARPTRGYDAGKITAASSTSPST
jgi:hypothetical protein